MTEFRRVLFRSSRQIQRLIQIKQIRDSKKVEESLVLLRKAIKDDVNLLPSLIFAVQNYCTVGEICTILRDEYGEFEAHTSF